MLYLLSPSARPILEKLASERTLCAFDFDGTLAPIVSRPEDASIPAVTRALFRELAKRYPCVIVSGRSLGDLKSRVSGLGLKDAIGNHGAEPALDPAPFRSRLGRWKSSLEDSLESSPGVWIEDKGISLAVHYRQARGKAEIRQMVHDVARSFDGVRVTGGKQVVNLVVREAPHKGKALLAARRDLHCVSVLYVGDDENDEDAFALRGHVVSVRIGQKRGSHARYFLRDRSEMDTLLRLLIELRPQREAMPVGRR